MQRKKSQARQTSNDCHTVLTVNSLLCPKTQDKKKRKHDQLVLTDDKIALYGIYEDFTNIYKSYLRLMSGSQEVNPNDFESDFLAAAIKSLSANKAAGKIYETIGNIDDTIIDFSLVEVLNIIGLNGHRFMNHPLKDIDLVKNDYKNGLLRYKRNPSPVEEHLYVNDYRCIIRVVVKAFHPEVLSFKGDSVQSKDKACHLLTFENWLANPSEDLLLRASSEAEFFRLSTLRFWRLTDVDGFFKGNGYYRECGKMEIVK